MPSNTVRRRITFLTMMMSAALLISACGDSKPQAVEEFRQAFAELDARIEAVDELISTEEKAYKAVLKEAGDPIASLPENDRHADRFKQAKTKLKEVKELRDKQALPLAVEFREGNRVTLEQLLVDLAAGLNETERLAKDPVDWVGLLRRAQTEPEKLKSEANAFIEPAKTKYNTAQAAADKVKTDYPDQAEYVNGVMGSLTTMRDTVDSNGVGIQCLTCTDIVKMATHYQLARDASQLLSTGVVEFLADVETLPHTQTVTLLDIKVVFTTVVSRQSWDGECEFCSEGSTNDAWGPREVSLATGELLVNVGENDINPNSYPELITVFPELTQPAKLYPIVKYYIDDWDEVICHKVRELKDGKPSTSERPNPTDFCAKYDTEADLAQGIYWLEPEGINSRAIGMDILSKPAGLFDDQAIEAALPPGMIYVGDPNYGEWQRDNDGNDFWVFYGQYRFFSGLIGGPYPGVYRYEYDTWQRDHRMQGTPYYGTRDGVDRYGANSPMVGSRTANTNYGRDGLAQATSRGDGVVARSGGPGGGGK